MSVLYFFYYLNTLIFVIFSIAFFTLMERKILGYQQNRLGPNILSYKGILQPVSDALKLMNKEEFFFSMGNVIFYWFFPFMSFSLMLFLWSFYIITGGSAEFNTGVFFFLFFISFSSYGLILAGWSSNSKYSLMGGYRGVAQMISYEIILFLCLFIFFLYSFTFNFNNFFNYTGDVFLFLILTIFFFSLVCEVNRAPFDLAEGESELVSGFNVEYGGLKFAVIFLTEYGMMIFMSFFMTIFFSFDFFSLGLFLLIFMYMFLWFRSSFPRFRFDLLMDLTWKILINYLIFLSLFYTMIL